MVIYFFFGLFIITFEVNVISVVKFFLACSSLFPLSEFVRANTQKSRNGFYLFAANFFASQFQPITLPDTCFRFASRKQSRQVENRL